MASTRDRLVEALAWCTVLAVVMLVLALVQFVGRDPDSTVYAGISARLAALPVQNWIAPEWWGLWGNQGPFREHPVGIFLLPALLGKLGYPALQAGYAIGACFSIAALLLIRRVAGLVVGTRESIAVQWAALILPIAFVYRIRASQEYPVLVLLLVAIYATEKSRTSAAWFPVLAATACTITLVKGIFVVFVPAVCGLWLLWIRSDEGSAVRPWIGLALAMAAVALFAVLYEGLYRRTTGDSFFDYYLVHRLEDNMGLAQERTLSVTKKLYNVMWYSARLLWFAVPGTLALLLAATRLRALGLPDTRRREVQALYFALSVGVVYVLAMSLGANKADRFIFPAYFAVGVAGAIVAMRQWRPVNRLAHRLEALQPYALPLAWLVVVMAALLSERRLPYLKFWTS